MEEAPSQTPSKPPTNPLATKTFECTICDRKFSSKLSLKIHNRSVHKLVSCGKCDRKFQNLRGVTTHMRHAHAGADDKSQKRKKHDCEVCGKTEASQESLQEHMQKEHKETKELSVKKSPPPKKHKEDILTENQLPVADERDQTIKELKEKVKLLETQLKAKEDNKVKMDKTNTVVLIHNENKNNEEFKVVKRGGKKVVTGVESPEIQVVETLFDKVFSCDECESIFKTKTELKTHKEKEHAMKKPIQNPDEMVCHLRCEDGQCKCKDIKHFSCTLCTEKFRDHPELLKHRKEKHPSTKDCRHGGECKDKSLCRFKHEEAMEVTEGEEPEFQAGEDVEMEPQEQSHKCNSCGTMFNNKKDLTKHIGENHKTFQPCRNFPNSNCEFDGECRFNHVVLGENEHICFKCGHITTNKTLLMKHIKEHNIPCMKYQKKECRYSSTSCIFSHEVETQVGRASESQATPVAPAASRPVTQQQDFRQAVVGHKPPDHSAVKNKLLSLFSTMLDQMPPQVLPQIMSQLQK